MDENYIPKNDEEKALIEEFEAELKEVVQLRESSKRETEQIKKLIEEEKEKRKSAHLEMAELVERLGQIEKRAEENKQKAEGVIQASNEEAEKKTSGL